MRWPRRIYKRRSAWHWLNDAGAPCWLWSFFMPTKWKRCAVCGLRGVGRDKKAASYGGGLPPRHYCSTAHYYEREAF